MVWLLNLQVELLETRIAAEIIRQIPFTATARRWGDEVYFAMPAVVTKKPDARDVIKPGELAYWAEGCCIAIGFGPTPVSRGKEIRLTARTNIWGKSLTDVNSQRGRFGQDAVCRLLRSSRWLLSRCGGYYLKIMRNLRHGAQHNGRGTVFFR